MGVDDAYTVLLMHMNGEDGSTTFTDEAGHTVTRYGDAQIDTAQSVFGGASALFDGTGDYIKVDDSDDFDFGTGDFSIDFRCRFASISSADQYLLHRYSSTSDMWGIAFANNIVKFSCFAGGEQRAYIARSYTFTTGAWYHIAVERVSDNFRIYVNGVKQGADEAPTNPGAMTTAGALYLGVYKYLNTYYFNGWIDELRISKGIARWTSDFTPPTAAYYGNVELASPALAVTGTLSATPKNSESFSAPPFSAVSGMSAVAATDTRVVAESLAAIAGVSASVEFSSVVIATPMAGTVGLSANPGLQLPAPPLSAGSLLQAGSIARFRDRAFRITYACMLGDLTIPITSFQARFKSGDPSFLSVVVPGLDYADDIVARAGDLLRVYMVKTYKDGNVTREMLGEVTQDALRLDQGARNQSITLDGYGTYTHEAKAVTLTSPQYKAVYGGKTRYRCAPDFTAKPGDTATVGDEAAGVISAITWAIGVNFELMEIEIVGEVV